MNDKLRAGLKRMSQLHRDGCVITDEALVDSLLPRRDRNAHKGDFGRVLILAGSVGYTGAPVLAANAALRTGAGLIFTGVPEAVYPIVAQKLDEPMAFPLACDEAGRLNTRAIPEILRRSRLRACSVISPRRRICSAHARLVSRRYELLMVIRLRPSSVFTRLRPSRWIASPGARRRRT